MASSTSFQKRTRVKQLQIAGCRPSVHNKQLLVSTGVPSLDHVLGGGLAVGTVLVIEEDSYGHYSKTLLKYFLAEGVLNRHGILLSSADIPTQSILDELPGPLLDDPGAPPTAVSGSAGGKLGGSGGDEDDTMKIAWRYQNQSQVQSAPGTNTSRFGHYYDLTKLMDSQLIKDTDIDRVDLSEFVNEDPEEDSILARCYVKLLNEIKNKITAGNFSTSSSQQNRNILRVGIHSLGSPQWGDVLKADGTPEPSLCRFLFALRSLMRTSYSACLITIPTHLFDDPGLVGRVVNFSDTMLRLESFAGSKHEQNLAFRDYHGLFHIVKLPRLNSLLCHMPDTLDLAFKLRKKKLLIEKLHLPPELSETVSRSQEDPVARLAPASNTTGCGTGQTNNKLDF